MRCCLEVAVVASSWHLGAVFSKADSRIRSSSDQQFIACIDHHKRCSAAPCRGDRTLSA